jgi:carboxylesterase type B
VAEEVYRNITEALNCSQAADKLACLRLVPTEVLNDTLSSITTEDYYQIYLGPLVDGDIIACNGVEQLIDGSFVKVPYILGDNSDDGTDFTPQGINTDDDFIAFYQGYGIDNATLIDLLKLYPNDPSNDIPLSAPGVFNDTIGLQFKRSATLIGDIAFKAPRRLAAQQWNKYTNTSLYSYRFNTIPNGIPDYYGVTHFQEVPFVFHNVRGNGFPNIDPPYFGPDPFSNRPESFFDLATLMSRMWASFIHDKNPNFYDRMFRIYTV